MALRVLFAGTPEFAAIHLQALINSEHEVIGVYTQPDRPAGRGKKLQPSPVKQVALEHGLEVFQPLNFKDPADVEQLKSLNADVMVVVAYGLILPQSVLDAPKYGCLNVHASLLPRWRGAAPIQRCIEAGDKMTGITIMQMDKGLDTGDMLSKVTTGILADDTGGSLHDRLAEMGPGALLNTLAQVATQTLAPEKQNDALANYAHKLLKEEALINWQQPADEIALRVRAFNPFPMAFTLLGDERIRVLMAEPVEKATHLLPGTIANVSPQGLEVACGEGTLRITQVQLPGKKAMSIADVINGQPQLFQPNHMLASSL
ncbi:methionyl-tRNA formyltransferase [Thalassolituus sp. LLYu03]|uniref:methionyl-tRNA formyltransferase n=1 Tax=Thalassolituus sp. LLYu03 TaxID=3421656 RepID=UPI003D2E47EA